MNKKDRLLRLEDTTDFILDKLECLEEYLEIEYNEIEESYSKIHKGKK